MQSYFKVSKVCYGSKPAIRFLSSRKESRSLRHILNLLKYLCVLRVIENFNMTPRMLIYNVTQCFKLSFKRPFLGMIY